MARGGADIRSRQSNLSGAAGAEGAGNGGTEAPKHFQPLWHVRDLRSQKSGPHAMVYLMNGDTYLGEWENNKKHEKGTYTCARTGSVYEGEWKDDVRDGYGTLSVRVIPSSSSHSATSTATARTPSYSIASRSSGLNGNKSRDGGYNYTQHTSSSSSALHRVSDTMGTGGSHSRIASTLSLLQSNKVPEDEESNFGGDSDAGGGGRRGAGGSDRKSKSGKSENDEEEETLFSTNKHKIPKTAYPLRKLYAGGWKDDRRCGFGTYFRADGSYYEGEWEGGVKKGWGTMHYGDGSRYDGEWFDEKRHGQGILLLPNQDRYEGMWLNDQKEGPGKFIYKTRRQAYEGEWVKGTPRCGTLVDLPPLPTPKSNKNLAAIAGTGPNNASGASSTRVIDSSEATLPGNWKLLGGRGTRYLIPEIRGIFLKGVLLLGIPASILGFFSKFLFWLLLGLAAPHDVINTEREHIVEERVHRLLKHKTNVDDEDDEDDDHYDSYDAGKGLRSTTVPQSNGGGGGGNMIAT